MSASVGESLFTGSGTTGRELEYMLSPCSIGTYAREYWGRRPLYVRGHSKKFANIFDRQRFDRAVANARPKNQDAKIFVRANFARGTTSSHAHLDPFSISPEQVPSILAAGGTICVNWINEADETLDGLARALKAQLGHSGPARFNAYLSPDLAGARMHFDARIVTTMQIEGTKTWRISRTPAVAWPRSGAVLDADFTASYVYNDDFRLHLDRRRREEWETPAPFTDGDFEDVTLEAGDLLVLPAGTWHSPQAQKGASLAINFACDPLSFSDLLADVLRNAMGSAPSWRSVPPFAPIAPSEGLTEDLRTYLAARLKEATAAIAAMTPDSPEIVAALGRRILPPHAADVSGEATALDDVSGGAPVIERDACLRVSQRTPTLSLISGTAGAQRLMVFTEKSEAQVASAAVPLITEILAAKEFRASDCERWSDLEWPTIRRILQVLHSIGVLEHQKGEASR